MLKDLSLSAVIMGLLSAFVGFAGSFAIVLQGLLGAGATTNQAATGLMALSISMGLCGLLLSIKTRMPITVAWSTPGGALLAGTAAVQGGFEAAVGAFLVSSALLILTGVWKPLSQMVAQIPQCLANAMLAGILFGLCLAPVQAVAEFPVYGLLLIGVWALMAQLNKLMAIPAAVVALICIVAFGLDLPSGFLGTLDMGVFTSVDRLTPTLTFGAITGIAIPLYIVTMASQNIPGLAVLRLQRYDPDPRPLFAFTGLFSLAAGFFGGHAINLAAITAALCAGEDAHGDRDRRYWASIVAGVAYVLFGIFAGVITLLVTLAPAILLQAVAGLALIGVFTSSIVAAFTEPRHREASACTFLTTASGLSFAGISGAFWGLALGLLVYALGSYRRRPAVEVPGAED